AHGGTLVALRVAAERPGVGQERHPEHLAGTRRMRHGRRISAQEKGGIARDVDGHPGSERRDERARFLVAYRDEIGVTEKRRGRDAATLRRERPGSDPHQGDPTTHELDGASGAAQTLEV